MNKIYEIFWFIGGSDAEILKRCPTSEQNKHFGIGFAILTTAILAVISGTFAISTIAKNPILSLFIGIFWGFVIWNFDRLLISSMRKREDNNKFIESVSAIPRVLLAIIIALVISRPVEVEILKPQILQQIAQDKIDEKEQLMTSKIAASQIGNYQSQIDRQNSTITKLQDDMNGIKSDEGYVALENNYKKCQEQAKRITDKISSLSRQIKNVRGDRSGKYTVRREILKDKNTGKEYKVGIDEIPGGLSAEINFNYFLNSAGKARISSLNRDVSRNKSNIPNCGAIDKQKETYYTTKRKQINDQLEETKNIQSTTLKNLQDEEVEVKDIVNRNNNLVDEAKEGIFAYLIGLEKAKYSTVSEEREVDGMVEFNSRENKTMIYYISWAIMVFFFVIELVPILIKIITDSGVYDALLRQQEDTYIQQYTYQQKIDNSSNRELAERISLARRDIEEKVVEEWKRKELEGLAENPNEYLKKVIID